MRLQQPRIIRLALSGKKRLLKTCKRGGVIDLAPHDQSRKNRRIVVYRRRQRPVGAARGSRTLARRRVPEWDRRPSAPIDVDRNREPSRRRRRSGRLRRELRVLPPGDTATAGGAIGGRDAAVGLFQYSLQSGRGLKGTQLATVLTAAHACTGDSRSVKVSSEGSCASQASIPNRRDAAEIVSRRRLESCRLLMYFETNTS